MPPEVPQRLTSNGTAKELGDLFVLHKNRRTARAAIFTHQRRDAQQRMGVMPAAIRTTCACARQLVTVFAFSAVPCFIVGCTDHSGSSQPRGFVSRSELGDAWPLTVEDGVLACDNGAVTLKTSDGQVFAVNGTAKGRGFPEINPIWRTKKVDGTSKPLSRLPIEQRRAIFLETVRCEDNADREAEKKFPTDVQAQIAYSRKAGDGCKAKLTKAFKLTESERVMVRDEGIAESWPPLSPMRVDIGPLIKRGLALCQSRS